MKEYFRLYSNCLFQKGYLRSIIIDSQRNEIHFAPNDLEEILIKSEYLTLDEIYNEYGEENKDTIFEYFTILIELELGFFITEHELDFFPKLNSSFTTPSIISNLIIEDIYDLKTIENIKYQSENIGCEYIEFTYYDNIDNEKLMLILNLFECSSIRHIGLIIKYDKLKTNSFLKELTSTKLRLDKIILHTSDEDKLLNFEDFNLTNIFYRKESILNFKKCGNFNQNMFTINLKFLTESLNHNSCLNKKLSIDKEGNIKNCPSMPQSFGNIKDTTFEEALNHPDFKKYWNVTKDMIAVCKDCEFRHICTDCRAYTERTHFEENIDLSKPLKCGYNPYTNEWAEWSTNPLKHKAIEYYGMQELVKKDA
jgi:SPASM domain peptide maturase of grasp-with-spasm system